MSDTPTTDYTKCARGDYQLGCLTGLRRWSGSDLQGKAKKHGAKYARSREALFARLQAAGFNVSDEKRLINSRWHRVLVIDGVVVSAVY